MPNKLCVWCGGSIVFTAKPTPTEKDREHCLHCGRSTNYELESKVLRFQRKFEKEFRNWKTY